MPYLLFTPNHIM